MKQVAVIGIDLAKRSFQLHGARGPDGSVAFRVKLSREKLLGLSCLAATMRSGDGSLCSGQL